MKSITTATSPNTERDDFWLALKLLFFPTKWRKGVATKKLLNEFKSWLPVKHGFLFESGRGALWGILKSLNLAPDSEILLQAYTCVAVPDPILWAGLKPVYVDIREETFNMSVQDLGKKITKNSRVLIIQHTFGLPAEIDEIMQIAKKYNLIVIEDCAHALGAKYHDKYVGTFGDFAFFSFGRDKVISGVWGGVVVTSNDSYASNLEMVREGLSMSTNLWVLQQLLHPITFGIIRPTFQWFGRFLLAFLKLIRFISLAVYRSELEGEKPQFIGSQMPNALAILALNQFKKLSRFNDHRKEIASIYTKELTEINVVLPFDSVKSEQIYLRYTLKTQYADKLLSDGAREGMYLGDWYNNVITPKGVNLSKVKYEIGCCPVAENVASKSINLPTHINTSINDAERISKFIKKQLNEYKN
ncbi:MAG: hypothetical protein COU81_02920 [Candidatus Portnoybacteria bacterium CG10_big_fil_rev_8_21_14_0_10_36_7]|uniref:DegT/DnrJ/EryC1/StrS aminotransferase n=1 Tax=Candidatus Portnoybacteria bacterium CG10_big_fil_rev_8_21_14_0_10_36_7 TaxID=1974812 RepID=A0A2M8KDR8_9BACT|nr:MAG: hypothetical protein COU81_02920 [Candidatus Portnoybacteria bacterium CG10_big_fil_rev_8_21_14_0_10_36_7]